VGFEKDRSILRALAARCSEIAALPVQEDKRRLWRKLNALAPERPMVAIDQVCWNEINIDDKLTLMCENEECRRYENALRRVLFQWEYFPADMVVEPFLRIYRAVNNTGFGMPLNEETISLDETNDVRSHKYINQITSLRDIERLKMPVITHDQPETKRRMAFAHRLFDGVIELREEGYDPYLSIWDPISTAMSVEGVLNAIIDQPDMLHALAKKLSDGYMAMLDQLEEQGLLCHHQSLIHCTGAYADELPAPGFDPAIPRTRDIWMFGLAQMFSTISPAMFDEYEITYMMPVFERFGLVYYGCCDPLHNKMNEVRKIPHLRKISMSPWTDQARGAEEIGQDYVFSRKPNPAFLAMEFDESLIRAEFEETLNHCARNGCPVEFILKDISTVNRKPGRLQKWASIAMDMVGGTR
jgi:hypothetical protein